MNESGDLYDGLEAGCTGVEADVWLTNNDLLVGNFDHFGYGFLS